MMWHKNCSCKRHCQQKNWEKEYLGKKLSECKYYRVCCERFIEAPCKDSGCDCECERDNDCDCDRDRDC